MKKSILVLLTAAVTISTVGCMAGKSKNQPTQNPNNAQPGGGGQPDNGTGTGTPGSNR